MSLCPEAELRAGMTDAEFWEHVLQPESVGRDYDIDLDDIEQMQGSPCPVCGQPGACGYDADGRPMIHLMEDGDE